MAKKVRMLTLLSVVHANASFSFTCHIQSVVALSSNISRCGLLSHYPRYLLSTEYPSFPTQISANWSPCFCPCPLWLLPSIGQRAQNSESSDEKSEHLDPWHKFWVFPDSPDVKPTSLLRCSYPCVTSSTYPAHYTQTCFLNISPSLSLLQPHDLLVFQCARWVAVRVWALPWLYQRGWEWEEPGRQSPYP